VHDTPFVPLHAHSPIAGARGAGNIVLVKSRNLDTTSYSGPGAGRFPTANSVVSDIVRIGRGMATQPFPYEKEWPLETDFTGEFYTRITCKVSLCALVAAILPRL
jgi:homoserine dehydrogenase